jgi:hypothetical protein
MLQPSPREEQLGCLFGLVGGLLGFFLRGRCFPSVDQPVQGIELDDMICGLPAGTAMFLEFLLGSLFGIGFGAVLGRFLRSSKPND